MVGPRFKLGKISLHYLSSLSPPTSVTSTSLSRIYFLDEKYSSDLPSINHSDCFSVIRPLGREVMAMAKDRDGLFVCREDCVIISDMLCFMVNRLDTHPMEEIVNICDTFYDEKTVRGKNDIL